MQISPLAGVRIVECSMLGPAAITTTLADLGADVIKVEPPQGDYIREMTWPIVEGVSLMHVHVNRGQRSITLDLRSDEGRDVFLALCDEADAVVEAMRPGALHRLGIGFERLRKTNPKVVFVTISGYGMTGPYKDYPSHGIAYDTWAGIVKPAVDDEGFTYIPEHVSIGINVAPLYGALAIVSGVLHARQTGEGMYFDLAQSDAAAAIDWLRSETYKAYERPASEVTGNKADDFARRPPGTAGMRAGVRYQIYETSDGAHVLFMASEQEFWKNFCEGVGRPDLFEANPGSKYADHAIGNRELWAELRDIFRTKTAEQWLAFGGEVNTPIAPVNSPQTIGDDPQFADRLGWIARERLGAEQLPVPLKVVDGELPLPTKAPTVGEHTDLVLTEVLGWGAEKIAELREAGAFGS
jgi:crotonobetainyl-CoA:carnitine CoA-transferase CaiB-like acyl-CoA transferase